jgi:hypothetical protein
MIYLASRYSSPDPAVREERFRAACRTTAVLVRAGQVVYSPVVLGHPLVGFGLPGDWQFWRRQNQTFLEIADLLVVLMLDGWEASVGVHTEMALAEELAIPTRYLAPGDATGSPTLGDVAKEGPG